MGVDGSLSCYFELAFTFLMRPAPSQGLGASRHCSGSNVRAVGAEEVWFILEDFNAYNQPLLESAGPETVSGMLNTARREAFEQLKRVSGNDGLGIKAYCMLRGFGCDMRPVRECADLATQSLPSQYGHLVLGIIKFYQKQYRDSIRHFKICEMGLGIWHLGTAYFYLDNYTQAFQAHKKGADKGHLMCAGELSRLIKEGWGCSKDEARGFVLEQQAEQKGFYKIRPPYMDFGGIEWCDMSPGDRCIILWPTLTCFESFISIVLRRLQVLQRH